MQQDYRLVVVLVLLLWFGTHSGLFILIYTRNKQKTGLI